MQFEVPVAFLAESIGLGEVLFLFIIILALFGPRRLPEIARQIGKTLAELHRASQNFRDQVMQIEAEITTEKPSAPKAVPAKDLPVPAQGPSVGADATAAATGSEMPRKEEHERAG